MRTSATSGGSASSGVRAIECGSISTARRPHVREQQRDAAHRARRGGDYAIDGRSGDRVGPRAGRVRACAWRWRRDLPAPRLADEQDHRRWARRGDRRGRARRHRGDVARPRRAATRRAGDARAPRRGRGADGARISPARVRERAGAVTLGRAIVARVGRAGRARHRDKRGRVETDQRRRDRRVRRDRRARGSFLARRDRRSLR